MECDTLLLISVRLFYCRKHCSFNHTFLVGQSTATVSVASFSATSFVKSFSATPNVGSPSDQISRESSRAASTLESSSAIINMVSPSGTIDVSFPYVTTRTLNVVSSIAASFTTAALHSASQSVKTTQVRTAPTSTTEPAIASTVKPTITSSVNVDGCNNYTVLSEADRAQGHIVINSNYRCDRYDLVPGWYRFQGAAGYRMADKCVPVNHCGTAASGWLSGSHPTVAEGVVTRKVCYHYYSYYWSSNCCLWSNNIRVRNCGAFFLYELPKPPSCDLRYCGNGSAGFLVMMDLKRKVQWLEDVQKMELGVEPTLSAQVFAVPSRPKEHLFEKGRLFDRQRRLSPRSIE
ncbi:uncharacterized protein LOC110042769 [Orbicella faveolata]|uniref:uncharacterized protein LOC110042769 n=1 Tax=Orbicella faveolata TaxID=48498 RepID=UPI0009E48307|nr:uncharacterized protein LOC110042769 [Orbicella faveolata]